jgi:hypothetical protein
MLGLIIAFSVLALFDRLTAIDLRRPILMLLAAVCLAVLPVRGDAQILSVSETSAAFGAGIATSQSYSTYIQPTQTTKFNNYFFDAFGPYPIAAVVGPYAGSVVAVYAWYPNRYGAKDAFRIGNYSLLEYMGGNIKLEFFYTSPRSWLSRIHRCSRHVAPDPGSSR